jgi:hypothetical protein
MDAEGFVAALKIAVRDPAVIQTLGYVANPPGRKISDNVKIMSGWFREISDNDKWVLSMILTHAVDDTVFRLLSVIVWSYCN